VSNNQSDSQPTGFRNRPRRPSVASREVVTGLDRLERGGSFFGGALALLSSSLVVLILTTKVARTKVPKSGTCPTYYNLVHHECVRTTFSAVLPQYVLALVLGLGILWFAYRRKRSGVIVFSLILGAMLGVLSGGIFFVFLGIWLGLRAYRLQKYGVPSFNAASRIARENAAAKREGRAPRSIEEVTGESVAQARQRGRNATTATSTRRPTPSARYTPKKTKRKR